MTAATEGVLNWCGTELVLLPQRAAWWPEQQALLIADPHFGKAATFRSAAVPLPDATAADLQRLDEALQVSQADRLIVLGDLLHARQGRCATTFESIRAWRQQHAALAVQLVVGNHDRHAGLPPQEWEIELLSEPAVCPPFHLRHFPDFESKRPNLAGHLHPKFRLHGGSDRLIAPCFLLRQQCLVLPAFGRFIDSQSIVPQEDDVYFVVADGEICRVNYK